MSDIVVAHRTGTYPVHIVSGDADAVASRVVAAAPEGRFVIVSDDRVDALYGADLEAALAIHRTCRRITFAAGEASKTLSTAQSLWTSLFDAPFERGDVIVALGGGVTGDLAGFVAATAMRGVRFVQIPTTVLAMSDASIGGKTGVNIEAGKNLVGAFHAPEAVIAWTNTLSTLGERDRRSGLAEIVKSAWIAGDDEVSAIEADARAMAAGDAEALSRGVELAARVKAEIVTADELEGGRRRVLNLGHTFGHAIEASTGYGRWTHGEAVSMGMVLAAQFSRELGLATGAFESRMTAMLEACGLPTRAPVMSSSAWLDPMTRDKKRFGDGVRFVLGRGPGEIFDQHVEYVHLRSWLARIGVVAEDER